MPEQNSQRNTRLTDFQDEVSRGNVPGASGIRKFGYNSSMSSSFGVIWPLDSGTPDYPFPQASALLNVVSTSTNDSAGGTGARAVLITGLDSGFSRQTALVSLAGTSSVATTSSFSRVNRVTVTSVGTYGGGNTGAITVTTTSSNHVLAYIPANEGITQQCVYTTCSSETGYVKAIAFFPQAANNGVDVRGRVRQNADITSTSGTMGAFVTVGSIFDISTPTVNTVDVRAVLPPKTDFVFQCRKQGGAAGSAVRVAGVFNITEYDQ